MAMTFFLFFAYIFVRVWTNLLQPTSWEPQFYTTMINHFQHSEREKKRPVNSSPSDNKWRILTSILETIANLCCQLVMPSYEQKPWTHTNWFSQTQTIFAHLSTKLAHTPTEKPFNASLRDSLAVIYTSHHEDDEGFAPWFSPNADCSPTLPADLCNPDPDARWQV